MSRRIVLGLIAANLVAIAALALAFPDLMIAPGPLIEGHRELARDCFACHRMFASTPAAKCLACHKIDRIGVVTTRGTPVSNRRFEASFHRSLIERDCVACHGDHAGTAIYRAPNRFSHQLLQPAVRDRCESCHRKPDDALHRRLAGNCVACHSADRWKPASFDHRKYFVLDRDHDVECSTCHRGNDFSRYTCTGCHEHSPARMAAVHAEEGIADLTRCVECHRGPGSEGGGEGAGSRSGGGREDD